MYIKIHSSGKNMNNKGSCRNLVEYLEKENEEKDILEQKKFFDHESNNVSCYTVQSSIDSNKGKLSKDETRYYMVSINPSKDELRHICKSVTGRDIMDISQLTRHEMKAYENCLKDYTRRVMDDYAKNFNRGITGSELVYYGKVEHIRHHERDSVGVREGFFKEGEKKEGLQSHVHIIVSRMDKTKKVRLSPMANAKNSKNKINGKEAQIGFDRVKFVERCEKRFDEVFSYQRANSKKFSHYHTMKVRMRNTAKAISAGLTRDVPLANEAGRTAGLISGLIRAKDPMQALSAVFSQIPGAADCMKAISHVVAPSPTRITLEAGKKAAKTVQKVLDAGSL